MNDIISEITSPWGRFLTVSLAVAVVATAANVFIDFGALLHNIFCPSHGLLLL